MGAEQAGGTDEIAIVGREDFQRWDDNGTLPLILSSSTEKSRG